MLSQDTATTTVVVTSGAAGIKSLMWTCWKVLAAVGGMRRRLGVQHMMANDHQKSVV